MTEWVHKLSFTSPQAPHAAQRAVDEIVALAEERGWTFHSALHSERAGKPWGNR